MASGEFAARQGLRVFYQFAAASPLLADYGDSLGDLVRLRPCDRMVYQCLGIARQLVDACLLGDLLDLHASGRNSLD